MALPNSGPITMAMIAAEIGISASGLSLNDGRVRQLAGRPSGGISFADFYGKSWLLPPTIWLVSVQNSFGTNGGRYWFQENDQAIINFGLGGGPGSLSVSQHSTSRLAGSWRIAQLTSNQLRFNQSVQAWQTGLMTARITVTNERGSAYIDVPCAFNSDATSSCFTEDCLVLMADGSLKRIADVVVGDFVRTAVGISRVKGIDKPILGHRTLYAFKGGMKTSGEHSVWSRDPQGKQWWATHDMEQWLYEAATGQGPSFDQLPYDLTGGNVLWDYATVDGWSTEAAQPVPAAPDTQLYHLLLDTGGSYFVNGYLVSSMADSGGVDWHKFTVE